MSLSRAFTTSRRRLGLDTDSTPSFMKRSNTTKAPEFRPKISGPVELIHTTNILTYNAPDLPRPHRSNSASSKAAESDTETFMTAESTPPTSPDVAPGERDCSSPTPEPNHLSCYFQTAAQATPDPAAPAIPRRSPSHTKKASYEALARKRSVSRQSRDSDVSTSSRPGLTFSRASSTSTRASSASHSSIAQKSTPVTPPANPSKEPHPFGQELAQVSELAEEYGVGNKLKPIDEEEEMYLNSRGLTKFSADDYLGIVHSLSSSFFAEHPAAPAPLWI